MTTALPAVAVGRVRDELVARGLVDGLPAAFLAGVTRLATTWYFQLAAAIWRSRKRSLL